MRDLRIAPVAAGAALCLSMSACSTPDIARPDVERLAAATSAQPGMTTNGAEKLRRLDIMLMVSALRCRATRDDFTADYGRFVSQQMSSLNEAGAQLSAQLAARHGASGGQRALDRLSTSMANAYGAGHPWLDCGQLKQVARNLAKVEGRATLEEAADQLLSRRVSTQMAWAKR